MGTGGKLVVDAAGGGGGGGGAVGKCGVVVEDEFSDSPSTHKFRLTNCIVIGSGESGRRITCVCVRKDEMMRGFKKNLIISMI